MVGIGRYKVNIDRNFFKGNVILNISHNCGKYSFEIEADEIDFDTDITVLRAVENGNTLCAKAEIGAMPGKEIDVSLTFDGNECNGYFKVPYVGKIKINDAVKI
ncbi:MAG: hypothetical protein ACI4VW_04965 [Acutalibacteraceae bacterium]